MQAATAVLGQGRVPATSYCRPLAGLWAVGCSLLGCGSFGPHKLSRESTPALLAVLAEVCPDAQHPASLNNEALIDIRVIYVNFCYK